MVLLQLRDAKEEMFLSVYVFMFVLLWCSYYGTHEPIDDSYVNHNNVLFLPPKIT